MFNFLINPCFFSTWYWREAGYSILGISYILCQNGTRSLQHSLIFSVRNWKSHLFRILSRILDLEEVFPKYFLVIFLSHMKWAKGSTYHTFSTLMWVFNVFGLLELADSTNIKISFGFSSFSELKKFFLLLLLSLYWVFLFFSFGCGILVPHPYTLQWNLGVLTAGLPGDSLLGISWRKSEWSIYTLKIVTYTIIPTQVLSTGHGSFHVL